MSHQYLYFLSLIAARTAIVFVAVVLGFRLLGKRHIGQVNIYDLAMVMAVSNAVQNAMTAGTGNLTTGIVCAGILILLGRACTALFLRLPKIEQNLCGTPSVLINDGRIVEDHMRRESVTREQLDLALRQHGVRSPAQVRMAVLEIDGALSVVPMQAATSAPGATAGPEDMSRPEAG